MIKIIYGDAQFGGTETCILKIAKELVRQHMDCCVYFASVEDELKTLFESTNIKLRICGENVLNELIKDVTQEDIVLTVNIYQYFIISYNTRKIGCKVYDYIVHPYWIEYSTKNKFLASVTKNKYIRDVKKNIESGSVFFMDDQSCQYNLELFEFSEEKANKYIVALPMNSISINEEKLRTKSKNRTNGLTLLSIARAEFPFKGYLFGLAKYVHNYNLMHERDIKLTIISQGEGYEELKKIVEQLRDKCIQLINGVAYDKLADYYEHAMIYVGMGSTVIEASNYGLVCIPIEMYTFECLCKGLFSENPKNMVVDKNQGGKIDPLITWLANCSDDDFFELEMKSKQAFENNYSAERFVKKIFKPNDRKCYRPSLVTFLYSKYKYREIKRGYAEHSKYKETKQL